MAKQNEKEKARYLELFKNSISTFSEQTVKKHLTKVDFYLSETIEGDYFKLVLEDPETAVDGFLIRLGNYYPDISINDLYDFTVSLKKFYESMKANGLITKKMYDQTNDLLENNMDYWEEQFNDHIESYNYGHQNDDEDGDDDYDEDDDDYDEDDDGEDDDDYDEDDEDDDDFVPFIRYVKVKDGVKDYDGPYNDEGDILDFSGLTGVIEESESVESYDPNDAVLVIWDDRSREKIPTGYIKACMKADASWLSIFFKVKDLEITKKYLG